MPPANAAGVEQEMWKRQHATAAGRAAGLRASDAWGVVRLPRHKTAACVTFRKRLWHKRMRQAHDLSEASSKAE